MTEQAQHIVPAHVPSHLVRLFDFRAGLGDRPQQAIARLHEGLPVFYSPVRHAMGSGGGMWVVTRAADVRAVLGQPERFSSTVQGEFLHLMGEGVGLPPLDSDPPAHGLFRTLLSPLFTARRMVALEPLIRTRCVGLIDEVLGEGGCEFMSRFAARFPTGVFIDLMGLPGDRLDGFVGWAKDFIHGESAEVRAGAVRTILGYFRGLYRDPAGLEDGTIVRYLLDQELEGRRLGENEFAGVSFLLFAAGLDTVVSSLGFIFRLLAEDRDLQMALRGDHAAIPRHVEEMMRLFSPVTPQRVALEDTDLNGVRIAKGDYIAISLTAASRDPLEFRDPASLDADRNPNPHFAFGYGPHRCLGAQLARRDMVIAVEEWLSRVPPFRLEAGQEITVSGGSVLALDNLRLAWS